MAPAFLSIWGACDEAPRLVEMGNSLRRQSGERTSDPVQRFVIIATGTRGTTRHGTGPVPHHDTVLKALCVLLAVDAIRAQP